MEDAVHDVTTIRENRELRQQSKIHEHEHTEQQTDSMGKCSDKGDKTIEGMDTELLQQDNERAQDDMRISPKRTKKMKMEKTGEPQNERSRSSTRRTVHRNRSHDISPQHNNPPPSSDRPNEHHKNCHIKYQLHNCADEIGDAG